MDLMDKASVGLSAQSRANYQAASADVRAKDSALQASVRAAPVATEISWSYAQADLTARYQAYAAAVARAEMAAGADSSEASN
jgi:hypothetical protein